MWRMPYSSLHFSHVPSGLSILSLDNPKFKNMFWIIKFETCQYLNQSQAPYFIYSFLHFALIYRQTFQIRNLPRSILLESINLVCIYSNIWWLICVCFLLLLTGAGFVRILESEYVLFNISASKIQNRFRVVEFWFILEKTSWET